MEAMKLNLISKSIIGDLTYLAQKSNNKIIGHMDHLVCFVPGMLALGALEAHRKSDLELAKQLMHTCNQMYTQQSTGLGPEIADFSANWSKGGVTNRAKHYLLRPETVESLFIMYRITKEKQYKDQAWKVFQNIEKNCKTKWGYTAIRDVNETDIDFSESLDSQQSFFFSETLKYLFLIFSDENLIPLKDFVFSTEAHPLPRFNKNII